MTAFVDRIEDPLNGFHEQISNLCFTVTFGLCVPIIFLAFRGLCPKLVMKYTQVVCVWGFEGKKKGLHRNGPVKLRREDSRIASSSDN